ncbi:EVE domain-containing protein [Lichenicoccus sp.]|uniref:EVE domain-containing protein n=1 Tax=Lichenicoccus sp. TaxID=2781899 RepID=UPI003D0EA426
MKGAWIAVACAEHVRRGRQGGFMQVCHGKAAPLRRLRAGDGVVYYSPTVILGSKVPYRAFTAAGLVKAAEPYPFDTGEGLRPWRRNVRWHTAGEVLATSVLDRLSFAAGRRNWAYGLRFGLMAIPPEDFRVILVTMQAAEGLLSTSSGLGVV